jgi:hypothetical protein
VLAVSKKEQENSFVNMLTLPEGIPYDIRAREGNSQNYWPVTSSQTLTFLEFQKTVKIQNYIYITFVQNHTLYILHIQR